VLSATYVVDPQQALGRCRTLPWSGEFERQRQTMGRTLDQVWLAWDDSDEAFQRCHNQARASATDFMEAAGSHILRRGAGS
jgi:hypothetical protein